MPNDSTNHPSKRQLADYGLGKLSDEELAWVARHLEACPECRRQVEEQPPDSFVGQIQASSIRGSTLLPVTTPLTPGSRTELPPGKPADGVPAELAALSRYEVLAKVGQGGMGAV